MFLAVFLQKIKPCFTCTDHCFHHRNLQEVGKIINALKMNMPLCAVTFIVLFCLFSVHTTNVNMLLAQRTLEYFQREAADVCV